VALYVLKHGYLKHHFHSILDTPVDHLTCAGEAPDTISRISDLNASDELVVFSTKKAFTLRSGGLRCPLSLMIAEPRAVQPGLYALVRFFSHRFHRILSHDPRVVATCSNAERWIASGAWVDAGRAGRAEKTKNLSIIASDHRKHKGQALRHSFVSAARAEGLELDVFGRGYVPLIDKADGQDAYRFTVVIENIRSPGYFTEKLVDAALCRCVPLYWGDPEIESWFDPRGMILCDTLEELLEAARTLSPERYTAMLPYVEANREAALATLKAPNSMARIAGWQMWFYGQGVSQAPIE